MQDDARVGDRRQPDKGRNARDEQAEDPRRADVHLARGFDLARIADAPRVQRRVLDGFVEDQELDGADKVERELVRLRAEDLRREDRIEDGRHGAVELQVDRRSFAVVQREEQYRVEEKRRAVANVARVPVERSREQGRPRLDVLEKASSGRG